MVCLRLSGCSASKVTESSKFPKCQVSYFFSFICFNREQNSTPPRIAFVEDIVEFLLQTLPEFWKLGQAYFNGELQIKPDKVKQNEFKVSYETFEEKKTPSLINRVLISNRLISCSIISFTS